MPDRLANPHRDTNPAVTACRAERTVDPPTDDTIDSVGASPLPVSTNDRHIARNHSVLRTRREANAQGAVIVEPERNAPVVDELGVQ